VTAALGAGDQLDGFGGLPRPNLPMVSAIDQ